SDHTLWCWGRDDIAAPTETAAEHPVPTQVGTDTDWATVSMSGNSTCAVKMNGALYCRGKWLGDGTANQSSAMVRVGTATWTSVSTGNEVCAVKNDGTLWCWGNDFGTPLGDGSTGVADPTTLQVPTAMSPTQLGTDNDWATVSARGGTSCATKVNG